MTIKQQTIGIYQMKIFSISSSSDGNAYALYNDPGDIILIDAGVPLKRIRTAFLYYNLNISNINYIIVSHTHYDHIKGLRPLLNNTEAFIVCSDDNAGRLRQYDNDMLTFCNHQQFSLADIDILPLEASHDTPTSSFLFESYGVKMGLVTDTGHVSRYMHKQLMHANAMVLESNYSIKHLPMTGYPIQLQQRISSNKGHLSNEQAFEVVRNLYHDNLSHVMFAHVSKRSNSPDIVYEEIMETLMQCYPNTAFSIAPYDSFSPIIDI